MGALVERNVRDRERLLAAGALVIVLAAGAWLRLSGANWDGGSHLHPDERYISSVANVVRWPGSLGGYLDVNHSTLSPYNTSEGHSYSYGTLPLVGTKLAASALNKDDYDHLYLVGRRLSALADTLTIVLVFLIARATLAGVTRTRRQAGAVLAATLYALTPAAIQAGHFFTTDAWLVLLGTATFYVTVLGVRSTRGSGRMDPRLVALAGLGLGLTVACKVSGAFVALPILVALVGRAAIRRAREGRLAAAIGLGRDALIVLVCAYLAFRLASPYAFGRSSWLDLSVNPAFRSALGEQRDILDGKALFPPTFQWLLSPRISAPFRNLVVWQLGPPLGIAAVAGLGVLGVDAVRRGARRARRGTESAPSPTVAAMLLAFSGLVFLYMASRFQHMGRYLLPTVPLLAVAAAYGLVVLGRRKRVLAVAGGAVVAGTGAYALAFHHIYTVPNTRVVASAWIVAHVPAGSSIANEHWDDSLPVGAPAQRYRGIVLPVFEPDDATKLGKLYDGLSVADYYVLSSPRAWRTIGRLPDRYPLMTRFYRELFAGRLGFRLAASFRSEPELLGLGLHDLSAEEAFWVYDHPPVMIFRRIGQLSRVTFDRALCATPAPAACA